MLKHAVEEMKNGGKDVKELDEQVEIQVPVEAFIPSFYIPDEQEKISVYQKLAGSEEESILQEFEADLRDEYGEPPLQVQHLFAVLRLKMVCRSAGVNRVKAEDGREKEIVLTLSARVTAKEIMQLLQVNSQWKISGTTLRIFERILVERAKGGSWLDELTREVSALRVKAKEKKTSDQPAAVSAQ
jgi:transcription-repair coupling factor (superfamily II helicase)